MNFPLSPKDDAKMRAAFEMNLDVTSIAPMTPMDPETQKMSGAASDAKQFFKMLVSPKFGRKPTPSPSVPSKNQMNEAPSPPFTTPPPRLPKTLLGSPRLHRAIFGTSRDKRKKLSETVDLSPCSYVVAEESSTNPEDDSLSSFNSSLSSEFSPRYSPAASNLHHHRSHQRPPPLISPLQSPSVTSTSSGIIVGSPFEEANNGSCPGTPKTPLPKPAMGVSMIGKQRRTPLGPDSSPFGPPLSPPPSAGVGSLRHNSSTQFPYTLTPKEGSPAPAPPLILQSTAELEYPPVFEPGTYSLSEKNVEMHMSSVRTSLSSTLVPPVPAPRTKFLSSTTSRLSAHSPSMDPSSTKSSSACQQHVRVHVRLETSRSIDESSNAWYIQTPPTFSAVELFLLNQSFRYSSTLSSFFLFPL